MTDIKPRINENGHPICDPQNCRRWPVDKLLSCKGYHMATGLCIYAVMRKMEDIEVQRDEARRELCDTISGEEIYPITGKEVANRRGWDCYDEK